MGNGVPRGVRRESSAKIPKTGLDHVVVHDATRGDMAYAVECLHCGEVEKPPVTERRRRDGMKERCHDLQLTLSMYNHFAARHAGCSKAA